MPKGGTVTFEVEPAAVYVAVKWLVEHDPVNRSLFFDALNPDAQKAREEEYLARMTRAAKALIGWLKRRKRMERDMERMPLNIDRDVAKWMTIFDKSRERAFLGARPTLDVPIGAQYFFTCCTNAVNRRPGRPRISPLEASQRLAEKLASEIPTSSHYRLMAREAEGLRDTNALNGLLTAAAERTPKNSRINDRKLPN